MSKKVKKNPKKFLIEKCKRCCEKSGVIWDSEDSESDLVKRGLCPKVVGDVVRTCHVEGKLLERTG